MKESLMFIAKELFYSKGYFHTKISDITGRRGTSPANFYRYFNSKEEVLRKIIKDESKEFIKKLKGIGSEQTMIYEKINIILDVNMDMTFTKPNFMLLVEELKDNNHKIDKGTKNIIKNIEEANSKTIRDILDATELQYEEKNLACELISMAIKAFNKNLVVDNSGSSCPERVAYMDQGKKRDELKKLITQMCKGLNIPSNIKKLDSETGLYSRGYFLELVNDLYNYKKKKGEDLYLLYIKAPTIDEVSDESSFFYKSFLGQLGNEIKEIFREADIKARFDKVTYVIALGDFKNGAWNIMKERIKNTRDRLITKYKIKATGNDEIHLIKINTSEEKDFKIIIETEEKRIKYTLKKEKF